MVRKFLCRKKCSLWQNKRNFTGGLARPLGACMHQPVRDFPHHSSHFLLAQVWGRTWSVPYSATYPQSLKKSLPRFQWARVVIPKRNAIVKNAPALPILAGLALQCRQRELPRRGQMWAPAGGRGSGDECVGAHAGHRSQARGWTGCVRECVRPAVG